MDFLTGRKTYFLTGRAVVDALLLINSDNAVHLRDGIGRAFPDAGPVVQTPYLADRHGHLGPILGTARDDHPGVSRDQLDEPFGTGLHAIAAGHAGLWIHYWKAFYHVKSIKGAGCRAISKP
jgi:hypothetical protein